MKTNPIQFERDFLVDNLKLTFLSFSSLYFDT